MTKDLVNKYDNLQQRRQVNCGIYLKGMLTAKVHYSPDPFSKPIKNRQSQFNSYDSFRSRAGMRKPIRIRRPISLAWVKTNNYRNVVAMFCPKPEASDFYRLNVFCQVGRNKTIVNMIGLVFVTVHI